MSGLTTGWRKKQRYTFLLKEIMASHRDLLSPSLPLTPFPPVFLSFFVWRSEPEAAILRELAESFKPHVWLSVHSGMEALFMPFDHKASIPEGEEAAATLTLLSTLNQAVCNGGCAVGSGGKSVG